MKITDRIAKLILARKPEVGPRGYKRDLASTCGISYEAVRQWFAGDTANIKNDNLTAIAEGYDTTVDWLLSGKGEPPRRSEGDKLVAPSAPASAADKIREMLAGRALDSDKLEKLLAVVERDEGELAGGVLITDAYTPGAGKVGDEVWIAHYDVRGALGGGEVAHDFPEMLQDVRVSPSQLRAMGVDFKEHYHLKMITGWGQSMTPTIKHGDPLLVDISIKDFIGDGVYFFSYQGFQYIKRLQMKGKDKFKMISDNRKHKTEDIYVDETYIQARVLLVWNANLM